MNFWQSIFALCVFSFLLFLYFVLRSLFRTLSILHPRYATLSFNLKYITACTLHLYNTACIVLLVVLYYNHDNYYNGNTGCCWQVVESSRPDWIYRSRKIKPSHSILVDPTYRWVLTGFLGINQTPTLLSKKATWVDPTHVAFLESTNWWVLTGSRKFTQIPTHRTILVDIIRYIT